MFLRDVNALTPLAQSRALRVLQSSDHHRGAETQVSTRLIASSRIDLERAVAQGAFRAELYHCLGGIRVQVPALRQRLEDLPLLVERLLRRSSSEHGKSVDRVSHHAMSLLARYPWPENLKELSRVIDDAVVVCRDSAIHAHHLSYAVRQSDAAYGQRITFSLSDSIDAYERDLVEDALEAAGGNRRQAARFLQTTDRILNYKIRKHNIDCTGFRSEDSC